jgi:hypothetical protein
VLSEPVLRSIVPAVDGAWCVVYPEEDDTLFRMPVLAWYCEVRIINPPGRDAEASVIVTALTCNGLVDEWGLYALQLGDGPFITYFEVFDDEAAVLAHFRRERNKRAGAAPRAVTALDGGLNFGVTAP